MATKYELAHRVWPILVVCAKIRQTIVYERLAAQIRLNSAQGIRHALSPIQDLCLERNWPPLTILAIGKRSRLPGPGFIASHGDSERERRQVFEFPWNRIARPFGRNVDQDTTGRSGVSGTPGVATTKFSVSDRTVLVNGRGMYQSMFRATLMKNYDGRCGLCDTRAPDMLVASHILPWAVDSSHRLNPCNGILLCRAHDGLFEAGLIRITADLRVEIRPHFISHVGADLSNFLCTMTRKRLRAPAGRNVPDPRFLDWRIAATEDDWSKGLGA